LYENIPKSGLAAAVRRPMSAIFLQREQMQYRLCNVQHTTFWRTGTIFIVATKLNYNRTIITGVQILKVSA